MSGFLSFLKPARDRFFKDQDAPGAFDLVQPFLEDETLSDTERLAAIELAGLILRHQKQFEEASELYQRINDPYQAGYCQLLNGKVHQIQQHWGGLLNQRANHWCLTLFGMVTKQLNSFPTLFQVRNHLEADIGNLLRAGQVGYVDNIVQYVDFLQQLNLETSKFIGRAFMNASHLNEDWLDRSAPFLMKGLKALPNDPEVYYHLGNYKLIKEEYDEARLLLNQCLLISPTFSPAKEMLESFQ